MGHATGAAAGGARPGRRAIDPRMFRFVLGHFCTGITVVAAKGPDGPLGFTCQSFSSLSLDPPMILFSASRSSMTWPRIRRLGTFCVNVLAEQHEQVSVAMSRPASASAAA